MGRPPSLDDLFASHSRIAVDTAPLIYYLEGDEKRSPVIKLLLMAATQGRHSLVLSAVTEAELLVAPQRRKDEIAKNGVSALLDGAAISDVSEVTRQIARRAAKIRAEAGLRLPDALVAATGLESGCSALLGNDTAFRRMEDDIVYLHLDDMISGDQLREDGD